ncbi:hypothetical protein RhoFasK5_02198|nr:hypothetical protein [Rhodococcus kroppenstedtii]
MRSPSAPPASPPPCRCRSTSPNGSSTTPWPSATGSRGCSSACATEWSPRLSFAPSSPAPNSSTAARTRSRWTPTSPPRCGSRGRGRRRGCGICATRWCTGVIPMPSGNGGRKHSRGGASSPRPVSMGWGRWGRRCPPNAPPSSLVSSRDWPRRCAGTTVAPKPRGRRMRCSRWSSTPRSAATAVARSVPSRWSMRTRWRRPRRGSSSTWSPTPPPSPDPSPRTRRRTRRRRTWRRRQSRQIRASPTRSPWKRSWSTRLQPLP